MTTTTRIRIPTLLLTLVILLTALPSCAAHQHTFGPWETVTPAGCTSSGSRVRTCTSCGETEDEILPAAHTYAPDEGKGIEPTCTDDGARAYYHCTACGKYFADEGGTQEITATGEIGAWAYLPATGHTFNDTNVCDRCHAEILSLMSENEYFILPDLGSKVELHTEKQLHYLKGKYDSLSVRERDYKTGDSYPIPVRLTWEDLTGTTGAEYTVRIAETPDMRDAWEYVTAENSLDVYNLKIATTYFWTVGTGDGTSAPALFTTTARKVRCLYIDGVNNARDLGGWETAGGKTVRQGLLYRTAKLDGLTEAGQYTASVELGIRTEIDHRSANDNSTGAPLTESYVSGATYCNIGSEDFVPLFEVLADEANYPIAFHCAVGADRTGKAAFVILGLLGVGYEDICRDYMFTNFASMDPGVGIRTLDGWGYYDEYVNEPGETLQEKIFHKLTETYGVSAENIYAMVRIMGGDIEKLQK